MLNYPSLSSHLYFLRLLTMLSPMPGVPDSVWICLLNVFYIFTRFISLSTFIFLTCVPSQFILLVTSILRYLLHNNHHRHHHCHHYSFHHWKYCHYDSCCIVLFSQLIVRVPWDEILLENFKLINLSIL